MYEPTAKCKYLPSAGTGRASLYSVMGILYTVYIVAVQEQRFPDSGADYGRAVSFMDLLSIRIHHQVFPPDYPLLL